MNDKDLSEGDHWAGIKAYPLIVPQHGHDIMDF